MNARRRLIAATSMAGALLALTACEKPAPIVTIVNEGRSTYAQAGVWCFEEQTGDECARRNEGPERLEVLPGTLGIDVDKELADGRWQVRLVDQARPEQMLVPSPTLEDQHYYSLNLPELPADTTLLLTVSALDEAGEPRRGSWEFELTPR